MGRWGTSVAITALLVSQAFVGTATAADTSTRDIYVGPDSRALDKVQPIGGLTGNGTLAFTPVSAGGLTASDIYVRNRDNQTLTHVVITIDQTQPNPDGDVTISDTVLGNNASSCPASNGNIVCDFGNLKAGASRAFTLLLSTPTAGSKEILAVVTFNESTNPNGGNPQIRDTKGTIDVQDGGCDDVQTFLPPGHTDPVATSCPLSSTNTQITSVVVPGTIVSAIHVADVKDANNDFCAFALGCFGELSVADIAIDTDATVTWTITWQVPSNFNASKLGILHFPEGSTTPDLNITVKKDTCKTATATGCFVPGSVTLNGTTLTAVIRTAGNGAMKGFS